jgi:hypothetical protein
MKKYTKEELETAKNSAPKPLVDFLNSASLGDIYGGLLKKHKLSLKEMSIIAEICGLTLLNLDSESALATNIHTTLPELSNATTNELVADIHDRIFKEAARRVSANIVEKDPLDDGDPDSKLSPEEFAELEQLRAIESKYDDDEALAIKDRDELKRAIKAQQEEYANEEREAQLEREREEKRDEETRLRGESKTDVTPIRRTIQNLDTTVNATPRNVAPTLQNALMSAKLNAPKAVSGSQLAPPQKLGAANSPDTGKIYEETGFVAIQPPSIIETKLRAPSASIPTQTSEKRTVDSLPAATNTAQAGVQKATTSPAGQVPAPKPIPHIAQVPPTTPQVITPTPASPSETPRVEPAKTPPPQTQPQAPAQIQLAPGITEHRGAPEEKPAPAAPQSQNYPSRDPYREDPLG